MNTQSVKGLIDCHTHTRFSVDSDADEKRMIERAIELGLTAYAVTDHCEVNRWFSKEYYGDTNIYPYFDFKKDYEGSVERITALKEEYSDRIKLVCGVELGQAQEVGDIAEIVVNDERVDYIICSVHQLPGMEDFALIDYTGKSTDEIYSMVETYFQEIVKLCRWGKFDILGHLTYFLRYINGEYGYNIDISRFDDVIAEAFRLIIQNGKGIEINTSGLRQKYGGAFPELKYVKLYKDLGGTLLSLGSDAHYVEHVGAGIAQGAQIAREAGFDKVVYFTKHKPEFIKLQA